jgi:hypothetical protein
MKTRILIMRPDQPHETRDVELPGDGDRWSEKTYQALKQIVEPIIGRPLEHVTVLADFSGGFDFKRADMFVNENGHLENPPMQRNEAATKIYRRNALLNQGYTNPEELPWIAGPAVLFEHIVWL